MRYPMAIIAITLLPFSLLAEPISYQNCQQPQTIEQQPTRILANDINNVEMALALGLDDHLVGAAGIMESSRILPNYRQAFNKIPQRSPRYLTPEQIRKLNPDLILGGWNYGFAVNSPLTPEKLQKDGIASYLIRESCIHGGDTTQVSIKNSVFADLRTLGRLTGREHRAAELITAMTRRMADVQQQVADFGRQEPIRIFVYDSGWVRPYTIGSYAVLSDAIRLAGGHNQFSHLKQSWPQVTWDKVADANPELILIVDYGFGDGYRKRQQLLNRTELQGTTAIEQEQFFILPYSAAVSGVRSVGLSQLLTDHLICQFSSKVKEGEFSCIDQPY